jgi:phosphatidylserine/phosphatidylglycerophosphate/cardiolipin synthase-like enzyme
MTDAFSRLSDTDLRALIAAISTGRVASPWSMLQVSRVVPASLSAEVRTALREFQELGFSSQQIALVLELLASDRVKRATAEPPIDLVTSGPEAPGISNRDTSVVVRELFAHAQRSVMVVGYAIYQGQKVFESLAARMTERPHLDVQFFLNVSRPDGDSTSSEILLSRFKQRFKDSQWPAGCRLPAVFYDPRSVADDGPIRSSLHAKCIVVDQEHVFVSSANFTEAAQERNIEVGLNIQSPWLAKRLTAHFKHLAEHGLVVRAF